MSIYKYKLMSDTLYITDFAYGWLYAESQRTFVEVLETGFKVTDYWETFRDVPLDASEHREYEDYDLNFWYEEDDNKWHCTAYAIEYDDDNNESTNTLKWLRLW